MSEIKGYHLEFIFVDDGSTDDSFNEMKIIKNKLGSKVKLIQLNKNYGQLSALRCGWKFANWNFIGVIYLINKIRSWCLQK